MAHLRKWLIHMQKYFTVRHAELVLENTDTKESDFAFTLPLKCGVLMDNLWCFTLAKLKLQKHQPDSDPDEPLTQLDSDG